MTGGIARAGVCHVFLRDMVLLASIGVEKAEHGVSQRIRVNVDLGVAETVDPATGVGVDRMDRVVNYAKIAEAVRDLVAAGHVKLAETLAEQIAAACLGHARVLSARVRVEKLDVFTDMDSAGVEVERCRSSTGAA